MFKTCIFVANESGEILIYVCMYICMCWSQDINNNSGLLATT